MTVSFVGVGVSSSTPVYILLPIGISQGGSSVLASVAAVGTAAALTVLGSASLTGLSGTVALGTLALNLSPAVNLTGIAGTGAVGTVSTGIGGQNLDLSVAASSGSNMIILGVP